jgi:ubiquinone biosynthesis protein UbiJ
MVLDASQPLPFFLSAVQGRRPRIDVSGDATLASDVSWLFDHLRWDIEDDLAPWLGPVVARELVRWGGWLAVGVRDAAKRLSALASRSGVGSVPST